MRIAIIGAGMTGLSAAYELIEKVIKWISMKQENPGWFSRWFQ
jgi:glycine/D-amino acid oxidase-like deaminating enzyme